MKTCMSTLVSCICIAAQGKSISGVKDADNASKLNQYPKCMYVTYVQVLQQDRMELWPGLDPC